MGVFKYLKLVCLAVCCAILIGCAAPANKMSMTIDDNDARRLSVPGVFTGAIQLGSVSGGTETNPMLNSEIGDKDFKSALRASLIKTNLLAKNANARYKLDARILDVDMPMFGLDFDVTTRLNYQLTDKNNNSVFWDTDIAASHTATFGDAAYGVTRLRMAQEGAAKKNIVSFIESLNKQSLLMANSQPMQSSYDSVSVNTVPVNAAPVYTNAIATPIITEPEPSNEDLSWEELKTTEDLALLKKFILEAKEPEYLEDAKAQAMSLIKTQQSEYTAIDDTDVVALLAYLNQWDNPYNEKVAISSAKQAAELSEKSSYYLAQLTILHPEVLEELSVEQQEEVSFYHLGNADEGLAVVDLIRMTNEERRSGQLLAAKVRSSNATYKNFSFDEIDMLHEQGLDDELIAAMIEVTQQQVAAQQQVIAQQPSITQQPIVTQQPNISPIYVTQEANIQNVTPIYDDPVIQPDNSYQISAAEATPGGVDYSYAYSEEPEEETLGDVVGDAAVDCAKYIAAKKGCGFLPFGSSICISALTSDYSPAVIAACNAIPL